MVNIEIHMNLKFEVIAAKEENPEDLAKVLAEVVLKRLKHLDRVERLDLFVLKPVCRAKEEVC